MMGWRLGWHGMGLGWLLPVGLVFIGVYLIVGLINGRRKPCCGDRDEASGTDKSKAMGILDERYARGEINDEEYRQKKAELRK